MNTARAETVAEISSAILLAAGEVMKAHGDDPNGGAIVAAGFAMALKSIGEKIDPQVPRIVRQMLSDGAP